MLEEQWILTYFIKKFNSNLIGYAGYFNVYKETCGLSLGKITSTIICEDNLHIFLSWKKNTLKKITQNIFFQNSSSLIIFKGTMI